MQGPNRPTIGEQLAHAEWVTEAVRLALKHWSSRRIAKKLGLHHSTVSEALKQELASRRLDDKQVEAYRNVQRETLFRLLARWEPKALRGDKDAALVHHKYLERWAKLDGLDAPAKSELSGPEGGPIAIDGDPYDALLSRLARLATAGGAGPDHPGSDPQGGS